MGVLKRLVNKYERGSNYELGNSLNATAVSTLFGTGGDAINVLDEYAGYAWKAINVRAKLISSEDLFVERLVNKVWTADPLHEFNAVLEGENEEGARDQSELLENWSKSMDLFGEAFWYFSKGDRSNKPFAIYPLNPNEMTVMVAGDRITGFLYQSNGKGVTLDLDEVAYWFDENPGNKFRGVGPMQSAGLFVKSGRYSMTYVNNFLENNAIPAGVIVAQTADDNDWAAFKEQWASKYGGVENQGKTGFLRGNSVDFIKTGMSLGEIKADELKNLSRDDIMMMFGVSKPMLGVFEDINRASAVTARQLAAVTITEPAIMSLRRKLSRKLTKWYGPQFRVGSTDPVPEDAEEKLNEVDKGIGRWMTVNEARAAYGLPEIPGGDTLDLNGQTVAPSKSLGKVRIKTKSLEPQTKTRYPKQMKESFRSDMEDRQVKFEQQIFQETNQLLKEQKQMVLSQLQPKKLVDANFDEDAEARKLEKLLFPIMLELAKSQGQAAIDFVASGDTKFVVTPVMEKYILDSLAAGSNSFTRDTKDQISKAIAQGLQEGESITDISKRVDRIYDDVLGVKEPGYRIDRLVRTEVIRTSNEITEAAYKQSGVVEKKEWFANPGRCEFCASLDGSVISLGATFVPKDANIEGTEGGTRRNTYADINHPPTHPACRCTLIPVVED